MTPVNAPEPDDDVVRDLLAPFERVQPVRLSRHSRPRRSRRLVPTGRRGLALIALVGATVTAVAAGGAAVTGVLSWNSRADQRAFDSPFGRSPDPAAVPGSTVRLSLPGPASSTFVIVTKTITVGTHTKVNCTAVAVKDAQARWQRLTLSCGTPGALAAEAATGYWQVPSGGTYTIITGPTPTPTAAKVALLATNGVVARTEPVAGGNYLVYAPEQLPIARLVFYDAHGRVVARLALSRGF